MSTDHKAAIQAPEILKKGKKTKGDTNDSAKKRKREQEVQQPEVDVPGASEPSKKKSKKSKVKGQDSDRRSSIGGAAGKIKVEEENLKDATVTAEPVAKELEPITGGGDEGAETADAVKPVKKKKPRKPKSNAEPTAGAGAPMQPKKGDGYSGAQRTQDQSEPVVGAESDRKRLDAHSPFVQETTSFYLALSPCAYDFPLEGLCAEHISPLLLTYYPPLKGVVLSYSNPRISEHPDDAQNRKASSSKEAKVVLSKSIDEYAVTYVWLCLLYTSPSPRDGLLSRMPSSA